MITTIIVKAILNANATTFVTKNITSRITRTAAIKNKCDFFIYI